MVEASRLYGIALDLVTLAVVVLNFAAVGCFIIIEEKVQRVVELPGNAPFLGRLVNNSYVLLVSISITWPFASIPGQS